MDAKYVFREVHHYTVEKYGNVNEEPDTTPLETPAKPSPKKKDVCFDASFMLILYIISIGCIVLGSIKINDCPAQKMLPIGLIIFGVIWVVALLPSSFYDFRSDFKEDSEDPPRWLHMMHEIIIFVEFGMLIALCYWYFSMDREHCDSTLAYTVVSGSIIGIIYLGLCLIMYSISLCCEVSLANKNPSS